LFGKPSPWLGWIWYKNAQRYRGVVGLSLVRIKQVLHLMQETSMSNLSIEERVINIVVEQLGVNAEEVTLSSSFVDDLGADSLDTVELVMQLEEEFDTTISDDQAEQMSTIQSAVDFIKAHTSED
jgi:acyl carrier protein